MMRFVIICCLLLFANLLPATDQAFGQELKISHQWAEGTDGRDRASRVFVQEAESRAKGLKFRIYPKSSLNIQPAELLNALRNNTLEMAVYPLTYAVAQAPEFSLAGLPGLVPSLDAARALKGSEIHTTLQSIAEANGIRILTWWWSPGGFFGKNREISDPQSVQGLRMRAADPLFELMLQEAGASVINIPSTEVYAALQSGSLDALLTSYEGFVSLRLYEQAKFATVGSTLFMSLTPLVMSLATWNKLSPEQRSALEEAAEISDSYFDSIQRDVERRMVTTLRNTGVAIHRMTKKDYLTWLGLAQRTAWLEYTKTNPRAQDLLTTTVITLLENFGPNKDDLIDGIYKDEPKN
ncbi:MAG TPA: TRAP transporter substrate-binding protein DctP [Terriglobales bacterium]|nr:TRAP transporter substrate-binding protein DctP [Terriglobales bacterium]